MLNDTATVPHTCYYYHYYRVYYCPPQGTLAPICFFCSPHHVCIIFALFLNRFPSLYAYSDPGSLTKLSPPSPLRYVPSCFMARRSFFPRRLASNYAPTQALPAVGSFLSIISPNILTVRPTTYVRFEPPQNQLHLKRYFNINSNIRG